MSSNHFYAKNAINFEAHYVSCSSTITRKYSYILDIGYIAVMATLNCHFGFPLVQQKGDQNEYFRSIIIQRKKQFEYRLCTAHWRSSYGRRRGAYHPLPKGQQVYENITFVFQIWNWVKFRLLVRKRKFKSSILSYIHDNKR